ncbi:uncharacterized protein LOC109540676 [Dendroctonus ponderosae]|uniref:XK-related protein n=1 Tax=Dendroctonus ponderosae TaxID=77166 RepID=A0AAR5PUJ7_DENPD|nr:uncharacterized protein LOC109540676 [Dendroctonus ponderosae]KAH1007426.1 hypothetical protein HUJ04_004662 [Dendroctonus ponderosae]KAH1014931.1 hypothetical protein HUJ05_012732 [Dendroctonus ponderosae]
MDLHQSQDEFLLENTGEQPSEDWKVARIFLWIIIAILGFICFCLCWFGLDCIYRKDTEGHFHMIYMLYHILLILFEVQCCINCLKEESLMKLAKYAFRSIAGMLIASALIGKVLKIIQYSWDWVLGVCLFCTICAVGFGIGLLVYYVRWDWLMAKIRIRIIRIWQN